MKTNLIFALSLFWMQVFCIKAQNTEYAYVPGELIVKLKTDNTANKASAKQSHLMAKINASPKKTFTNSNLELWKVSTTNGRTDILQIVEEFKNHPDIEFIEPNYIYSATQIPNDVSFSQQWALNNDAFNEGTEGVDIAAIEAWAVKSATPTIVVGIIDTGVDWRHPDLIDNIWQNLAEDADGDGHVLEYDDAKGMWVFDPGDEDNIDNDGNGYTDDFIGWNFVDNNNNPLAYQTNEGELQAHGTHVAGILGASGNNGIGIAGVTWNVQMAVLKYLSDENGAGSSSNAIEAIMYAVNMGIPISNNSWGGAPYSFGLYQAILNAQNNDHLFIAAAGNGGFDHIADNNDLQPFYPASYPMNNIISVASTDSNDDLSTSSNFGIASVDIAAPGVNILSCLPGANYGVLSGTSMAAPHVAGACALLWEKDQDKRFYEIKDAILSNTDPLSGLEDKCVSEGRLNLFNTITAFEDAAGNPTTSVCRNRDSLALLAIYQSTGGTNWFNDEDPGTDYTWDLTKAIDDWYGVYLNSEGCVDKLELQHLNLIGEIPVEIGDLKELTRLRMYDNALTGEIPATIGALTKLERLFLQKNQLSGSIPVELGNLQQLRVCALGTNELSGDIPVELFELFRLSELGMDRNNLTGNIPAQIGNLINLTRLDLSHNQITGTIPAMVSNLKHLEYMVLNYNTISGEIPAGIGSLIKLKMLLLNNNSLEGSMPGELGNLNPSMLRLHNNNLSGCYDPYLANIGIPHNPLYTYTNFHISTGNNFDAPWQDFMNNNGGACWASAVTQVWPGDFNNDGQVSNDDLVFYGIAAGNTGALRNTVSDSWEGNLCPNWSSDINGVNGKHQDANGDGLVDELDKNIILENLGLNNYSENTNLNKITYETSSIEFSLEEITEASILSGTNLIEYQYALKLTSDEAVKGFSCIIDFKTKLQEDTAVEIFENCIRPDVINAVFDYEKGILELAITNTEDIDIDCINGLAKIVIVVMEDDIIEEDDKWVIKLGGITSETDDSINESGGTTFQGSSSLSSGVNNGLNVSANVSPQKCDEAGKATLNILGGTPPYNIEWNTGETTAQIAGLTMGTYTATVTDSNNVIGIHNIDVAGELQDCNFDADCPTVIDFDEFIPDAANHNMPTGIYTAGRAIQTSASILENDEVELKAGKLIRLKSGFSMKTDARLSAIKCCKNQRCKYKWFGWNRD